MLVLQEVKKFKMVVNAMGLPREFIQQAGEKPQPYDSWRVFDKAISFLLAIFEDLMRGQADPQTSVFSYVSLADRVPQDHPVRRARAVVCDVGSNSSRNSGISIRGRSPGLRRLTPFSKSSHD